MSLYELIASYDNGFKSVQVLDDMFVGVCGQGRLDIAQWLYNSGLVDINANKGQALISTCGNNHLHIAKWLHSNGANINIQDDEAFIIACKNGHMEMAKWLYDLDVDIHAQNDSAFKQACAYNHIEIAKWLYELDMDIANVIHNAFLIVCEKGNLEIAKWLYEINLSNDNPLSKNIMDNNIFIMSTNCMNEAFHLACKYCYMDMVKWLHSLGCELDVNVFDIVPYEIDAKDYKTKDNIMISMAQWICSIDSEYSYRYVYWDEGGNLYYITMELKSKDEILDNNKPQLSETPIELCINCLEDNKDRYVELLQCSHTICEECYLQIERCPFNCNHNMRKIKLITKN